MPNNKVTLHRTCPFCGAEYTLKVRADEYNKYLSGELVQKAFKSLDADLREMIITGICPKCFPK